MDNESGGTGIIIFGVGILVGAFTAFLILKSREQQAPAVAAQQPYILAVPSSTSQNADMSAELQRLYAELQRLRQENAELRTHLQIAAPQGPVITPTPRHAPVPAPAPQITAVPKAETKTVQAIQNEEEWIIKKDKRGRLEGITVHRKVMPIE
jgi:hypothetical protein